MPPRRPYEHAERPVQRVLLGVPPHPRPRARTHHLLTQRVVSKLADAHAARRERRLERLRLARRRRRLLALPHRGRLRLAHLACYLLDLVVAPATAAAAATCRRRCRRHRFAPLLARRVCEWQLAQPERRTRRAARRLELLRRRECLGLEGRCRLVRVRGRVRVRVRVRVKVRVRVRTGLGLGLEGGACVVVRLGPVPEHDVRRGAVREQRRAQHLVMPVGVKRWSVLISRRRETAAPRLLGRVGRWRRGGAPE